MPVFLNESQAGSDQTLIGFPHLLICMGVVLQTKAWLYGYHFDDPGATQANAAAFADFITNRGGNAANAVRLYGCANWKVRYDVNRRQSWKNEMQAIAAALGYQGIASGFDTSIIDPQDGTYVEYVPEYQQRRCRIYYKRNEKMDYVTTQVVGAPNRNIAAFKENALTGQMVPRAGYPDTSSADIQVTASNKGQLHELNYFLRLVNFDV